MSKRPAKRPSSRQPLPKAEAVEDLKQRAEEQGLQYMEYDILDEPMPANPPLPPEVEENYERLLLAVQDGQRDVLPEIRLLAARYPDCSQLQQLLVAALQINERTAEADRLAEENYRKFPDYLFARCSYLNRCIGHGQADRLLEIFPKLDLKLLYPERDAFHLIEFITFASVVAVALAEQGKFEDAERYLDLLDEMAPDHPATEGAMMRVAHAGVRYAVQRMVEESRSRRKRGPARRAKKGTGKQASKKKPGAPPTDSPG